MTWFQYFLWGKCNSIEKCKSNGFGAMWVDDDVVFRQCYLMFQFRQKYKRLVKA